MLDLLFDPSANFPAPNVPDGGTRIGNAEVAFADTDQHAGMNLAAVGPDIVADLIGYRAPLSDWCSGDCPSAVATDGPFRLELVLPHLDWKANEPISGTAILGFGGAAPTTIYGSGGSVINFAYAEVGGTRKVDPVWTADCGPHALDPATPINEGLSKSGAFDHRFAGSGLRSRVSHRSRRPAGRHRDVTANATLHGGRRLLGGHSMNAIVRITVRD